MKRVTEALIFVSDKPVSQDTLKEVLGGDIKDEDIKGAVEELNKEYAASGRTFSVKEIAGGYQMMTDPVYSKWITELYKRPDKLRGPALETLAIIAYKQPITRSEIEAIRGVNVDGVLHTLEERDLIRTRGRREGPGRPILYGTTNEFLRRFGLKSLDELPNLKEFQEADLDFIKDQEKSEIINTQTGRPACPDDHTMQSGKPACLDDHTMQSGRPACPDGNTMQSGRLESQDKESNDEVSEIT